VFFEDLASSPPNQSRKVGQALIEVIVGLVVVLVLTAGLLQLASLTKIHTDVFVNARGQAGDAAMQDAPISPIPSYILDVSEGPDEKTYSRDDTFSSANPEAFRQTIVNTSVSDPAEWSVLNSLPYSPISELHDTQYPQSEFGLLQGSASETVPLLPAVRHLLYRADEIEVECNVWMTWTKGIY